MFLRLGSTSLIFLHATAALASDKSSLELVFEPLWNERPSKEERLAAKKLDLPLPSELHRAITRGQIGAADRQREVQIVRRFGLDVRFNRPSLYKRATCRINYCEYVFVDKHRLPPAKLAHFTQALDDLGNSLCPRKRCVNFSVVTSDTSVGMGVVGYYIYQH